MRSWWIHLPWQLDGNSDCGHDHWRLNPYCSGERSSKARHRNNRRGQHGEGTQELQLSQLPPQLGSSQAGKVPVSHFRGPSFCFVALYHCLTKLQETEEVFLELRYACAMMMRVAHTHDIVGTLSFTLFCCCNHTWEWILLTSFRHSVFEPTYLEPWVWSHIMALHLFKAFVTWLAKIFCCFLSKSFSYLLSLACFSWWASMV